MAQDFELVSIETSTTSGAQLAERLEKFSKTMRSMMSGPDVAKEFIEGLWLRTNDDGTAEIVYSNTDQGINLPLFKVDAGGVGVHLTPTVGLGEASYATAAHRGMVELATNTEALAGTSPSRVPAVKETQAMIAQAIDGLVNGASGTLDTLKELAAALGDDPDFSDTILAALNKRIRVDADQNLSAEEQAKAQANLGLGSLSTLDQVGENDIENGAIHEVHIANSQISKRTLAADVFASSSDALVQSPPLDQALSPQAFFAADEVAVYATPSDAPTTLAGNGYKRRFYIQSTGGMYAYVPTPVEGFVLQGTAPGLLNDLADVNTIGAADGDILVRSGTSWVKKAHQQRLVGEIVAYAGASAPEGWFICNGDNFNGEEFDKLAEVLGSATLPDLRGEFIRGLDNERGVDVGRVRLSPQTDEFKAHYHHMLSERGIGHFSESNRFTSVSYNHSNDWSYSIRGSTHYPEYGETSSVGGTETRPRNIALNYIIKHD